jgi:hypothetical protein
MEKGSAGVVENIALISLIWIFCGCRQMKGTQIFKHKKTQEALWVVDR